MRHIHRKTTPGVSGGKVQRKNRSRLTPNYYNTAQRVLVVDRRKPGPGYRHILRKTDIERFVALLPDWHEMSKGLNAVVLAPGDDRCAGWHSPGVVAICAWDRELRQETYQEFYADHQALFEMIGVACEPTDEGYVFVQWTESTIRAYQLAHIFLHELGHHHDRMTTRSQIRASRGEGFAERYAIRYGNVVWERYLAEFGPP